MNKPDFVLKVEVCSQNRSLYKPDILYVGAAVVEGFVKSRLIAGGEHYLSGDQTKDYIKQDIFQ
jgi:hypothetical protein